jgi:hypothetical protein
MAPGLRPDCCVTAAAALVVDAGALEVEAVGFAVGDALDDEELDPVAPGEVDSSGQSCSLGQ